MQFIVALLITMVTANLGSVTADFDPVKAFLDKVTNKTY